MDPSTVADRKGAEARSSTQSQRQRQPNQDYDRQAVVDSAVRQQRRAANNRDAARRQAESALRDSIERDRLQERQNMQAGVEKMVRSVVRKESTQAEQRPSQDASQQQDSDAQAQYVRDRLNSAYSSSETESVRNESSQPSPSQRQQQRAIDDYQQSIRNSIDHTVELVI